MTCGLLVAPSVDGARVEELLARQYRGGVTVTNCVVHAHRDLSERPDDCHLCAADLRNAFRRAVGINEWLNAWKDDAAAVLAKLREAAEAAS